MMINNICENNTSSKVKAAFEITIDTPAAADNRHNVNEKGRSVASENNSNSNSNSNLNFCRGGVVQTTYEHGIWYSEIIDEAHNACNNAIVHKQQQQQQYNDNNIVNKHNNYKENVISKHVWLSTNAGGIHQDQQQKQPPTTNNACDIIIVDIEDDDDNDNNNEVEQQRQQHYHHQQQISSYCVSPKFFINENMQIPRQQPTSGVATATMTCGANRNPQYKAIDGPINTFNIVASNKANDASGEDEDDSLDSMETLSDNVSIWIDGEKHWVAGVDANTTCSELIWALLNYQNAQQQALRQHPHALTISSKNEQNISTTVINNTNCNQYDKHQLLRQQQQQHQQQQQQYKQQIPNAHELNLRMSTNEDSSKTCAEKKPNIQYTANTNNTPDKTHNDTGTEPITTSINQSMPINTKENYKIIPNSTLDTPTKIPIASTSSSSLSSATPFISSLAAVSEMIPPPPPPPPPAPLTLLPLTLPPGIATVSQLATEYVIVKQYHHCEEYLDGSTKVFDVLPPRNGSNKKVCELLLRHLGPAPAALYINNTTPQLSSLISTDKDSGMGSPVGSARSAKFRRRKHKSSQWLAQANTLHPKLSRCTANERLMKIILAQDETIQQQLSLLREKERQITKIEEEKHRKRERELGKNYLLETYLNGLDEADCQPEIQETSQEIFIDEPYRRAAATATATTTTNPRTTITPVAVTLAAGAATHKIPSAIEAFNAMARHKVKEKEVKKEKKKKRHKERQTKDEETQAKDFNLKTNKNKDKDKEKVDKQQQHHYEAKALEGNHIQDDGNEREIQMQILWLEKIYTINKQLQKEEELAAKLHAKVRKHQLRKAQQTQHEVQMDIDKLDNNLALQCGDIRKVEANLMQTNEQLQKKLLILERLSMEYLEEQHEQSTSPNSQHEIKTVKEAGNLLKSDENTLLSSLEKSLHIETLSLNNIKSKEEAIKLEKIIAKPSKDLRPASALGGSAETKQSLSIMTQNVSNNSVTANANAISFQTNHRLPNVTSILTNDCTMLTTIGNQLQQQQQEQRQQQHQQQHQHQQHNPYHQQELMTASDLLPATAVTVTTQTTYSDISNDTVPNSCMFIDKNMLSSFHVQNAKTIKKQMFHTQTTPAVAAAASAAMTSLQPPPTSTSTSSALPKRQFQQTMQQHMPTASTFLTSRPQNSHQILQPTNIVILEQQQPCTLSPSCSTHSTSTAASSPAIASVLFVPHPPPTSSSPSPSIMAMNTVDISQLGTLV